MIVDDQDACPDEFGWVDLRGCDGVEPLRLSSVTVRKRKSGVTVVVTASRAAGAQVVAQRQRCRTCDWRTARSVRAGGTARTTTIRLRLAAGRYRLKVVASDGFERATTYRTLTLRR